MTTVDCKEANRESSCNQEKGSPVLGGCRGSGENREPLVLVNPQRLVALELLLPDEQPRRSGLISAVREGRKEEFKTFEWKDEPPDPQPMDTFLRSNIDWEKRNQGCHRLLREFYRKLIWLRREIPALAMLDKNCLEVSGDEKKRIVLLRRWNAIAASSAR
jgi:1,4-alpha-glucan branching enzyme